MNKGKLIKITACVSSQIPASMTMRGVFKPGLEELTDERYDIRIYDSEVSGSEKVTYDYTRSGVIGTCMVGAPVWSEIPVMVILDFPLVFRDVEYARRCYQGRPRDYIAEELEADQPVTLMSWFPDGVRVFSSNKKLAGLDDSKGRKLRMPSNPIHVKLTESLEVNMVIIDMGEVFTTPEQGVADEQDNPLSTVRSEGQYEVRDYIYDTNHITVSLEFFTEDQFWDNIDEVDREIFRQVADKASNYVWNLYIDQLADDKQFMKDNGLAVTDLSDKYREAVRIKIQPVYDHLDEKYEQAGAIRKMTEEVK